MKSRMGKFFLSVLLGVPFLASAQAVIISSPGVWLTQRTDSVVVKAQIDTSNLEKKEIEFKLSSVNKGKKHVVLSKKFKIEDNMGEFSLGALNKNVVGGTEFLELNWSIDGVGRGTVCPLGIVKLAEKKDFKDIVAAPVKNESDIKNVVSKFENPCVVGKTEFVSAWDSNNLYFAFKKSTEQGCVEFCIDGKNGKKAFLAYSDRVICFDTPKDSIHGFHFKRELKADTLSYRKIDWNHNMEIKTVEDKTLIVIPWVDIGAIPFDGRMCGIGVFAKDNQGKVIGSVPQKAKTDIPGTWTDLVLQK